MTTLGHFSLKRIAEIGPRDQVEAPHFKPRGLWFEVEGDDDWQHWCKAESFVYLEASFHYQITISDDVNLLAITNTNALDLFHERFKAVLIEGVRPYIDWRAVAEEYDGIQIAPYLWERRLTQDGSSNWYYSWDCASGCLWEPKSSALELLRPPAE